ncbi:MAG: ATP synthase F1 subunit delta [Clostridiales bacterium]
MPLVERRYAEALLKLSDRKVWIDKSLNNLKNVVSIYKSCDDLKLFLNSPKVKNIDKKEVMTKVLAKKFDKKFINFIHLLIDKGRINILPTILNEYIILSNKAKNIMDIEIISSEKLTLDQTKKIETKFKKICNTSNIKSNSKIDKSLIGGVKIIVGDKIYDNSIKGQLLNLKNSLKFT